MGAEGGMRSCGVLSDGFKIPKCTSHLGFGLGVHPARENRFPQSSIKRWALPETLPVGPVFVPADRAHPQPMISPEVKTEMKVVHLQVIPCVQAGRRSQYGGQIIRVLFTPGLFCGLFRIRREVDHPLGELQRGRLRHHHRLTGRPVVNSGVPGSQKRQPWPCRSLSLIGFPRTVVVNGQLSPTNPYDAV